MKWKIDSFMNWQPPKAGVFNFTDSEPPLGVDKGK